MGIRDAIPYVLAIVPGYVAASNADDWGGGLTLGFLAVAGLCLVGVSIALSEYRRR